MGQDIPPAPPEAEVIRLAREATGMTAQSAAEASKAQDSAGRGVSAAYWRDVERGHGGRRGERVPTRASARALAAMARVVGVEPGQLTGAGREDAARVLEEMLRREGRAVVPAPAPTFAAPDRSEESFLLDRDMTTRTAPHIAEIQMRLAVWARSAAQQRGESALGEIPDGTTVFPDRPLDAGRWDRLVAAGFLGEEFTLLQLMQGVAVLRVKDEDRRQGQDRGDVAAGLIRRRLRTSATCVR